jgi:hypothetical protein
MHPSGLRFATAKYAAVNVCTKQKFAFLTGRPRLPLGASAAGVLVGRPDHRAPTKISINIFYASPNEL